MSSNVTWKYVSVDPCMVQSVKFHLSQEFKQIKLTTDVNFYKQSSISRFCLSCACKFGKLAFSLETKFMEDFIMWRPDLYLRRHPKVISYLL